MRQPGPIHLTTSGGVFASFQPQYRPDPVPVGNWLSLVSPSQDCYLIPCHRNSPGVPPQDARNVLFPSSDSKLCPCRTDHPSPTETPIALGLLRWRPLVVGWGGPYQVWGPEWSSVSLAWCESPLEGSGGGVGGECVCKQKTWFSGNHHPPAVNPRIALRCCCGFPHPCQLHLLKSTHSSWSPQVTLLPLPLAAPESSGSPSSSPPSSQALSHSDLVGGRRKAV